MLDMYELKNAVTIGYIPLIKLFQFSSNSGETMH